jgi:hypothetical protein
MGLIISIPCLIVSLMASFFLQMTCHIDIFVVQDQQMFKLVLTLSPRIYVRNICATVPPRVLLYAQTPLYLGLMVASLVISLPNI